MKKIILLTLGIFTLTGSYAREFHVAKSGNDAQEGSVLQPFLTISRAVQQAMPGDTITVHTGTYREWVNPIRGGVSDEQRIVYRAAPGEKVEIKGSEVINTWQKVGKGVWKVILPNAFFGDYNPYSDSIHGDWFNNRGRIHHTGEVFLNGKSFYEKERLDLVQEPRVDADAKDPEGTAYTWYCENNDDFTTIWANFHQVNPNRELTEITTRRTCFYPEQPGVNFITISGFHISQAATQWGAPTAEQVGMISTHWNKGWIIENNVISDSKCSGITLGKERTTGHNVWSADRENVYNDGNIHYIEVTFRVLRNGWSKENTGSHMVRNNTIFNCEQTGICGSMGAAFSVIENNHIHDIWVKRQFDGAEIGGIKFHAAVDALIRNNRIHETGRGLWLDWMTQGTRVSCNLFYDNDLEDLFLEVNHGPFIVDNNIFLSPRAIRSQSEGGAYVHNLIAGSVETWPDPNRFTPYFLPHSTDIAGLTTVMGGDDRVYNNIFIGGIHAPEMRYGLETYNDAELPVWIDGNVYYKGAVPSAKDQGFYASGNHDPQVELVEDNGSGTLFFSLDPAFFEYEVSLIAGDFLGKAKVPKAPFENADGTALSLDTDYFGKKRSPDAVVAGPFSNGSAGRCAVKLW
ncbi:MAG: right-handed parallel beta-helix repeat-containing protein [Bacteroidales bacterium]